MILQDLSLDEIDAVNRLFVVFRIRGDDLNTQTVTSDLNIPPTRVYQKGEKFVGKKYDPIAKKRVKEIHIHHFSVWDVSSESQQDLKRVKEHIEYLLNILEPHSQAINRYLEQNEKYVISFYIRWEPKGEHGSYRVPGDLLGRMAKLCHFTEFSFIGTFSN
jgi:hypothetical protein